MFPASSSAWMPNVSQLDILINRACHPTMGEPNYAIHLEVAEYINQKKANTPREAAMYIAQVVNHRNPHVAMLALALLETLVQSCGYPFHLQISTKEFLNELVRRFPERPPPFPGPVMQKILDLIHSWKEGICVESRWKDDFANIRDMHRLLTFKGYRFRDTGRQQASSAPSSSVQNLKSAEELEAEDREAQQAKLQELIRRGTPRDLAAAQELMKTLAGANPDAKPDYRTQSLTELNKLESKVILLNEILDNVDTTRGERFVQGDVYHQVASILRDARPKIQKWISDAEEDDDPESLDTYLQINDQINTVLKRYESYKKGDYTAAANPIPAELSNGAQGVSLIDLDDAPPAASSTGASSSGLIDNLADLFNSSSSGGSQIPQGSAPSYVGMSSSGLNGNQNYGVPMNAGLGVGSGFGAGGMAFSSQPVTPAFQAPTPMGASSLGLPPRAGTTSPSSGTLGSIRLGTPQLQPQNPLQPPHYSQSPTPGFFGQPMQQSSFQQQQQQSFHQQQQSPQQPFQQQQQSQHPLQPQVQPTARSAPASGQAQGKDPFADLVGLF